jgi:hypothetical protein
LNEPVANAHVHAVHRRIGWQRKGVDGLDGRTGRVDEGLADGDPRAEAGDVGLDLRAFERAEASRLAVPVEHLQASGLDVLARRLGHGQSRAK